MKRVLFAAILVALIGTLASPAAAAPVNYDESVSGDLSSAGAPLTTFTLDVGANTIAGTETISTGPIDVDSFAFVVPAGTQLLAGQVQLTDEAGDITNLLWNLRSGSANFGGGSLLEAVGGTSPGTDLFGTTPLGPGTYNVSFSTIAGQDCPCSGDYVFTLTLRATSAVPEPGTLALLALGVAGLAVARRRHTS